MLEIRTFGGLSLKVSGRALAGLGSRKAEAILAYLVVEGRQVNRSALAALFWPESSEAHAQTALRVVLSILRKNLGAYLDISRQAVAVKKEAGIYLDLTDLEMKLASSQVDPALELYCGEFLQGFHVHECPEFEDWLRLVQERTRRSVAAALHGAVQQAIDGRDCAAGLEHVRRLLELDPLDETAHQQCMLLLALDHQRSVALFQYEQCRDVLQAELGIEPSQESRQLYEHILRGDDLSGLVHALPGHNLPASQTSFVGREIELAQIGQLIHDPACRLLTLVGPGGSGKTRLALQAAVTVLRSFPDGACFVPLESIPTAGYLVPAVAEALGFDIDTFASQLDPKIQLLDYLRSRSLLILMDGFEHLTGGAGLLSEMLAQAPNIQLLVTSRQKLDLKSEWVYPVEGLPVIQGARSPVPQQSGAVQLFAERARQQKPDFQPGSPADEHVIRICQMVEGMPLGIELAAAWSAVLSPGEIAAEMEKSLDFLAVSTRDVPQKQRSLRAAFDSSWQLLSQELRQAFSNLSVFRGSFDRQAALQVAGVSLPQLSALQDRSLLRTDEAGRFTTHALLRQFAAEKLELSPGVQHHDEIHSRHCNYYVSMLSQRKMDFYGSRMLEARDEIRPEIENLRAAVTWGSTHWEARQIRQMLVSLLCFYTVQGWHEGILAFQDIARLRPDTGKDAVALSARSHLAFLYSNLAQIDESEAISRADLRALEELGLKEELSECLHNLGVNASFCGKYEHARELLEEAILLGREHDHIVWPTYLLWLGHAYFLLGEYEQGLLCLSKCYDLFERQGNLWGTAFAMSKMGLAATGLGAYEQAMQYHSQALSIFERTGNQAGKGYSLSRMSMCASLLEDYTRAVQLGQQGCQIFEELGHRWGMSTSLCHLGFAQLGVGDPGRAKESFSSALQHSRHDRMLPLSLYALAGLACTLAQEGNVEKALELYNYVKRHPQTPAPFLLMAARWIGDLARAPLQEEGSGAGTGGVMEPIDQVIDRVLENPDFRNFQ